MIDGLLPHRRYADRARIERFIARLHHLGPRVLAEFLNELAVELEIDACIVGKLQRYAQLDPAIVKLLGGNQFAPTPTRCFPPRRP